MRLKSKTAGLLKNPKFEEYLSESYSDNIDQAIKEIFPEYNVSSERRHNVTILSIKTKEGKKQDILHWNSRSSGFLGESRGEKDRIDEAIRSTGLKQIWPSVTEATKKVKQHYGVN